MTAVTSRVARPPEEDGWTSCAGLYDSARTVVGGVAEEAGFLARAESALFVVLHRPADRPARGVLTVCGSLFAEQHTDYRREVRLARLLAPAGIAVARFHYGGFGNSTAAAPSFESLVRDAIDVTSAARRWASVDHAAFLGVGMGSLVAAGALAGHPEAPLLLWKPVVDGARFFRDFFRARLIAAARSGEAQPTTEELLAGIADAGRIDVMGFTVTAGLYESLSAARLAETFPRLPRRVLVQSFRGARAAALERLVTAWRADGCLVETRPTALAEDPYFVPDGAAVAASVLAAEEHLMTEARDWLASSWETTR